MDEGVSICFLKMFAGDYHIAFGGPRLRGDDSPRLRGDDRIEEGENLEIRNPVLNSEVEDSSIFKAGLNPSLVTRLSSLLPRHASRFTHRVAIIVCRNLPAGCRPHIVGEIAPPIGQMDAGAVHIH